MKLWFWDRKAAIDRWWSRPPYREEPVIKLLRLPKIRERKAEKVTPWAKLRRVK